jgi:hypothetical protein
MSLHMLNSTHVVAISRGIRTGQAGCVRCPQGIMPMREVARIGVFGRREESAGKPCIGKQLSHLLGAETRPPGSPSADAR